MTRLLILGAVVALAFLAAKPAPSPSWSNPVLHNSDYRVEQQGMVGCQWEGYEDCVTNTTDCIWDVDDHLFGGGSTWEGCLVADGSGHQWSFATCSHKRFDPIVTVVFDPPGRSFQFTQADSISWMNGKSTECFRRCVFGPSWSEDDLVEIPYMGGSGGALGVGLMTTVQIGVSGARINATVAVEVGLPNGEMQDRYCPTGFPIVVTGTCDPVGDSPRFCW